MSNGTAARDPLYREAIQRQVEKLLRETPYHSLRLPDGTTIPGLIGIEALEERIASFPIPESLEGCRVLDVGAASGWNSFAMAARGAAVLAVDCVEFEEFTAAQNVVGANVDYRIMDVDELSPASVGTFDYVLFLGVLYHLRHPLLALEKICALTKQTAFVESFISDPVDALSDSCSMEFYETDELGGQIDNWYGPTAKCLAALCRAAGFVRVTPEYVNLRRAGITCHRRWEPEPERPFAEPAWLFSAVNNRTHDVYFHSGKDEYLCVYFRSPETGLTRDDIRIEVDGYGANTLVLVHRKDDEWQANSRLPPGMAAGEHWVRLRTARSRFGNRFPIEVTDGDVPRPSPTPPPVPEQSAGTKPLIQSVENSLDRTTLFHGYPSERLCCRFTSDGAALQRQQVHAAIDGRPASISFLTDLGRKSWEASIRIPGGLSEGTHCVRVRTLHGDWSDPAEFTAMRT